MFFILFYSFHFFFFLYCWVNESRYFVIKELHFLFLQQQRTEKMTMHDCSTYTPNIKWRKTVGWFVLFNLRGRNYWNHLYNENYSCVFIFLFRIIFFLCLRIFLLYQFWLRINSNPFQHIGAIFKQSKNIFSEVYMLKTILIQTHRRK